MKKLKNCPFCGRNDANYYTRQNINGSAFVWVECDTCGAKSRAFSYSGEVKMGVVDYGDYGVERSADAWNRRPTDEQ